jgi:hypothetical protein
MGQLLAGTANHQSGGSFASTTVPAEEADELFHEVDVDNSHAFRETLTSKRFVRSAATNNIEQFLTEFSSPIERYVTAMLHRFHSVRVAVFVHPTYTKVSNTGQTPIPTFSPVLRTRLMAVLRTRAIPQFIHEVLETLRTRHATYMRESSGLRLESIRMGDIQIARVEHMAYAGRAYAELPEFLSKKHAIVNVHNNDNRCFGYALLSSLHPAPINVSRRTQYDQFFALHPALNDIEYPVEVDQFEDVEARIGIPFNVYTYYDDEGRARYPLYISREDPDTAIDLLFWDGHYAWIKSFTRFLGDQNPHGHECFYCKRCFGRFTVQTALDKHKKFCTAIDSCQQVYTMPKEGTKLKFINVRYQVRFPFTIYADFEALTVPCTRTNPDTEPANIYQKHVPISVGLKLVSTVPQVLDLPYESYLGDDVVVWFLNRLIAYRNMAHEYLFDVRRLTMTQADQVDYDRAISCYLCGNEFPEEHANTRRAQSKVRDHDHITGAYRGAAHSQCNLRLRTTYKIPVFIHNFRGYDSHLIVPAFTHFKGMVMQVIGQGLEKYLSLTWDTTIVFKDSLQFLSGSLDALVACLKKSGKDKFKVLTEEFAGKTDNEGMDMLLRKGVYPYDYMNHVDRFAEQKIPPIEEFFSRLQNKPCSAADHKYADDVWKKFGCHTMRDYHDLYLKTDVLLLADVFESFRTATLSSLGLDPAYYVSGPQLSWDCMMKMTRCNLTLLSDPQMFNMIHANLRGGITMISKRYAEANNKYMEDAYNPTKPSSYILYLDANNLYGYAMSQSLPYDEFTWMTDLECEQVDWLAQTADQDYGYFVECDLHYPDELHDLHDDYPLAPERMIVEDHLLSEHQEALRERYAMSHTATSKLVPNFFDKKKMLLHYRNLKFYLQHGLVVTKMHRGIRFKQSKWLELYIRTNTEMRALAKDPVEVKLRKDMNNIIYGKTCENLTKRTDIKLVNTQAECDKLVSKPQCLRFQIFADELVGIESQKVKCVINKPTYVGFAVLELSKLCMYEFHYEHFTQWYPEADLLFTDTDSLVYHVETEDLYADLAAHREYFDFSGYPHNHPLFSDDNKMVVGKMKDESAGGIITEYVGLRPKMYSYLTKPEDENEPAKEAKRAKGIQRAAITDLRHADYKAQLNRGRENYVNVRRIGQKHHRVFTIDGVKRGLCAFDDKRYLLHDGIHTVAHGHHAIRREQTEEFDESIPESALTSPLSPWAADEDDADVTGFITMSHADSVRQGLRPRISRGELFAMVGGADLRREIDSLPTVRGTATSDDDDDVSEPPRHAHRIVDDDDDGDSVDDDANEVDDLLNIVDVAMYSGMTEPY